MSHSLAKAARLATVAAALAVSGLAGAAQVSLTITAENLAPANSISFAPLHFGVHSNIFDAFNIGQVATAPIISVAEGGGGMAWQAAFAAADPTATRGTIGMPLFPGMSRSLTVTVDTAINPFFTFASMAVPSNDFFIGNDSAIRLFNNDGSLARTSINQKARQIWDAGSELLDPAAAAFVVGSDNDLRTPQGSVVAFNFGELHAFNGVNTAAGYAFNSQLSGDTDVYRISFAIAPVPEPETYALMLSGLLVIGAIARRRRGKG